MPLRCMRSRALAKRTSRSSFEIGGGNLTGPSSSWAAAAILDGIAADATIAPALIINPRRLKVVSSIYRPFSLQRLLHALHA
jgi:hypothetical protein